MHAHDADAELVAALLSIRYRVTGPSPADAGGGPDGGAWAVEHLDGGEPGVCRVVRAPAADGDRPSTPRERWAGVDRLAGVEHPHVERVLAGADLDTERRAVVLTRHDGITLGALLAGRPPLAEAEAVTLVVPLAGALAALHDVGLGHGGVSARRSCWATTAARC